MKKRISALLLIVVFAFCMGTTVLAIQEPGGDLPNASLYLDSYAVDLVALGNGEMSVGMDVVGTGLMTKIGVLSLFIEEKVNGTWLPYTTVYGIAQPDFYMYNTHSYIGEYSFYGTAGVQYRATITAYARNSNGSDTGNVTSLAVTCHNP